MKALTAAEMREVDRLTTERYGISGLQLMEEAGKHVGENVKLKLLQGLKGPTARPVILCGKGNNGGDGLVTARLLKEGKFYIALDPMVFLFGSRDELRGDA